MLVHPYQLDPKFKHIHMNCKACVRLPLYVDGIYHSIITQVLKTSHIILVHLEALDNMRNPDIFTLNKERGYIFSECYIESFKAIFLQ